MPFGKQGSGRSALGIIRKYYPQVTRVVDAKRNATFQVTARDCRKSTPKNASECALATACGREHDGAIISLSVAYLINGKKATRYRVPQAISREIVSFDRHSDFAPGTYSLNAPAKGETLGYRKYEQGPAQYKRNQRKSTTNHHTSGIRVL